MIIPDGSWVKCRSCGQTLYTDRLEDNLQVCWYCNCHLPMNAPARIKSLTDADSFTEMDADLRSVDPLQFVDSKSYGDRLVESEKKTGLKDAIVCGSATLGGHPFMLGVMDFRFMGASMGWVGGEMIARLVEAATAAKAPVVLVTASGGARMQEGILSLMQMPKTCGALSRHSEAGLPYFAVLTNMRSVGVQGDGRTYDYTLALRSVTTTDFMTADWTRIPYDVLDRVSVRIVNEVPHINRIVYDITSKPPATIEWE